MGNHLTFWKFLTKLQKEADLNRLAMIQGQAGHPLQLDASATKMLIVGSLI